jgi:putative hydrolase of the HAD superfamily
VSLGAIQAITFDVGGTLITPWPSVGHIYAEVAGAHGYAGLAPELLNQQFTRAWNASKNFEHSRVEWAGLVDATFFGLIDAQPSRTFFAELFERFAQPAAWRIFEDVLPALNALCSRGFRLGVISNWDDRLRPLLRRLGLYDYFDPIVVSCEVGASKPARIAFLQAASQLGASPGAVLHVGDSLEMDVQGAQAAGFAAVWLDRKSVRTRPGTIHSLGDLPNIL